MSRYKKLRVMLLVHETLIPPADLHDPEDPRMEKFGTEHDVHKALLELGHEVRMVGAYDDLAPIRRTIEDWSPDIVFNLLEEFAGNSAFDYYVVSYFEMTGIPYTGCNPRGLVLARDKAMSKILLSHHRIPVPAFTVFPRGRAIRGNRRLRYPLVVKSLTEEGSVGISQASLVTNEAQLRERVQLIHQLTHGDAIAEQYIDGRELYVTVVGNARMTVLPVREIIFNKENKGNGMVRLATSKVKWDEKYRERRGIDYCFVRNLPAGHAEKIDTLCKRACRVLNLNGVIRFDLRLGADRRIYMLEANPNPAISSIDDCAYSAEKAGMSYEQFVQRIINLGLRATG